MLRGEKAKYLPPSRFLHDWEESYEAAKRKAEADLEPGEALLAKILPFHRALKGRDLRGKGEPPA